MLDPRIRRMLRASPVVLAAPTVPDTSEVFITQAPPPAMSLERPTAALRAANKAAMLDRPARHPEELGASLAVLAPPTGPDTSAVFITRALPQRDVARAPPQLPCAQRAQEQPARILVRPQTIIALAVHADALGAEPSDHRMTNTPSTTSTFPQQSGSSFSPRWHRLVRIDVCITSGVKLRGPEGAQRPRATSASTSELCGLVSG